MAGRERFPSGTDCRRTRSGESTTMTSWPRAAVSSADQGPSTRSVSPAFSRTGPVPRSWPWRVTASTIRLPLRTWLGWTSTPTWVERGGITTSAAPEERDIRDRSTSLAVRTASTSSPWSAASRVTTSRIADQGQPVTLGDGALGDGLPGWPHRAR